jgi:acyl-CoA synthetase (AMP-forming)/AMP-acid ligase II
MRHSIATVHYVVAQATETQGDTMKGLMQPTQLSISYLFDRAEKYHRNKQIITATATGRERITYGEWADRTRRLGGVLDTLGISQLGRVATFAWNTARHLELYSFVPRADYVHRESCRRRSHLY